MASIISQKSFKLGLLVIIILITLLHIFWLLSIGFKVNSALSYAILNSIMLAIFLLLIGNNLNYYRPKNFSFSYLFIWCLSFAFINTYFPQFIFKLFFDENEYFQKTSYVYLTFNILILSSYAAFCLIWYNQQDNEMVELRKSEAEMLNKEAELFNLRQQLQPHFLFNSLNSINALIGYQPAEARKMIQQLSDFLRYTIKKEGNQLVDLDDELQHLNLYLEIEKVRFGYRLNTNFDVKESTRNQKIPYLLLQPIIENAIKFGLYDTIGDVNIDIFTENLGNSLKIVIKNPFDPQTSINQHGTGFGLKSIKKRLQLLYSRTDLLKTNKTENIFTTEITIPQPE